MQRFEAIDIIAITVIAGGFLLTAFKLDGTISNILIMVVAYYFGKKTSGIIHIDKAQKNYETRNN